MSRWDNFAYSYVPRSALPTIMSEGLYGGKALLNRPDLLELVAKSRHLTPNKFKHKLEADLADLFSKPALLGPNVVFKLIPDLAMVSPKQPVRKNKLVPVKINLTQLLADHPKTKIFGMELQPYIEGISDSVRHHYLSNKELIRLLAMSPREIWETYNDIDDRGLYAPDVPHASIHTANGIIAPEYLQVVKRASSEQILGLLKLAYQFVDSTNF